MSPGVERRRALYERRRTNRFFRRRPNRRKRKALTMSLKTWARRMFALAEASSRMSNLTAREIAEAMVPRIARELERQPPLVVPLVTDEWRKYLGKP